MRKNMGTLLFLLCGLQLLSSGHAGNAPGGFVDLPYSILRPRVIALDLPAEDERVGGIIAADVSGDGLKDFIITKPGHIAVYDNSGKQLWSKQIDIQVSKKSEKYGLPGWHGPGVQAADVDGDKATEILFLTRDGTVHVVIGSTGREKLNVKPPVPEGAERWEHLVVANFSGQGDKDILLQATNADGYRMGRYLAAYALEDLKRGKFMPLWQRDDFLANAHNGARVADLDGDGRDEVLGGTIISPEGKILTRVPLGGHIDSIFAADIRPDFAGLEVIALEEGDGSRDLLPGSGRISQLGNRFYRWVTRTFRRRIKAGNRIFLYNHERLIWDAHYNHQEPQNAAVGDFDPYRPGLEVWCRSRYDTHQKPFVFSATGEVLGSYRMDDVAPRSWTEKGVEVISTIDWTGEPKQLAAAKERHKSGDVAIFDPMTGKFLHRFKEKADRIYVADVLGDWREEIIVLNGNELHIYENNEPNPDPTHPRLWEQSHYRRSKMTWNYYSP